MLGTRVDQNTGDNATNPQAAGGNIYNTYVTKGLDTVQVTDLFEKLWEKNICKLTLEAEETMEIRIKDFIKSYIEKSIRQSLDMSEVKNPDFQYVVSIAQREYVRNGNQNFKEILTNLLIDRTKESQQSLKQIILNESIEKAPKLTPDQLDILSIVFLIKDAVNTELKSLEDFKFYFIKLFSFFNNNISLKQINVEHLKFLGCVTNFNFLGPLSIGKSLRNNYSTLFSKGFSREEYEKINSDGIPTIKLPDGKLRLASYIKEEVNEIKNSNPSLYYLQEKYLMHEGEILGFLIRKIPDVGVLLRKYWNTLRLDHLELTSVGRSLAIANLEAKIDVKFDLGIWVDG